MPTSGARPRRHVARGAEAARASGLLDGLVGAASHRQECGADPRSAEPPSAPSTTLESNRQATPRLPPSAPLRAEALRRPRNERALRAQRACAARALLALVGAALTTVAVAAHAHPGHPRVAFDVERWRAAAPAPVFGLLFLDPADPAASTALAAWRPAVRARRIALLPVVMVGADARPLDVGALGSTRAIALDVLDVPGRFGARSSGEVLAWTHDGARLLAPPSPNDRAWGTAPRGARTPPPRVAAGAADVEWVRLAARPDLALTRTELTAGVFAACVHAGACAVADATQGEACPLGATGRQGWPMACISARGADALCAWIGARLPSVEELRDAATFGFARAAPWGHTPPSCDTVVMDGAADPYGSQAGCMRRAPWPPCSRPAGASREGLCDLLGNVAEWTQDAGPTPGTRRVFGGDFTSRAPSAIEPPPSEPADRRSAKLGLRCARAAGPSGARSP